MDECELLADCRFYNDRMGMTDGLGAMYKKKYCTGDYPTCARYIVFKALGRQAVPPGLYPNMLKQANEVIAENKTRT